LRHQARGFKKNDKKDKKGKKFKKRKLLESIEKLPTAHHQIEERRALFRKIDENGNGYLSLLEVRQGVWNILGDKFVKRWSRGWKSAI